jgi:hypothetical protein
MALGRYLGGIGLTVLGFFVMFFGIIGGVISNNSGVCILLGIIGLILMLTGGFYVRTAHRLVPQKLDIVSDRKSDRYCPSCGRAIPFDANLCPYCGKQF